VHILQEEAVSRQDWRAKQFTLKVSGQITIKSPHQETIGMPMLARLILGEQICCDRWGITNTLQDAIAIAFTEC
jgi:hypothetical protein